MSGFSADGDTVAVVDGTVSDLKAVVLDATTGRVRFSRSWSPSNQFGGMGVGRPAVVGATVVTMEAAGATDTALVAVDARTGAERWRQIVPPTFAPSTCGPLICTEQGLTEAAALVTRDPATGAVRWTSPGSQVAFRRDDALLSLHLGNPVLYRLDAATGAPRWRLDLRPVLGAALTTGGGWSFPAANDELVVSLPGEDGKGGTARIDPASGSVVWRRAGLWSCGGVSAKGVLLLCDPNDRLHRVDPANGGDVWVADAFAPPAAERAYLGAAADGSAVYGLDRSGRPIRVDMATGAVGAVAAGTVSWSEHVRDEVGRLTPGGAIKKYVGTFTPVPWDPVADRPAPSVTRASDVPDAAGQTVAGFRVYVDDSGTVRGLPA